MTEQIWTTLFDYMNENNPIVGKTISIRLHCSNGGQDWVETTNKFYVSESSAKMTKDGIEYSIIGKTYIKETTWYAMESNKKYLQIKVLD